MKNGNIEYKKYSNIFINIIRKHAYRRGQACLDLMIAICCHTSSTIFIIEVIITLFGLQIKVKVWISGPYSICTYLCWSFCHEKEKKLKLVKLSNTVDSYLLNTQSVKYILEHQNRRIMRRILSDIFFSSINVKLDNYIRSC